MIDVTALVCGAELPGAGRRRSGSDSPDGVAGRKPVVVWSLTRTCNLACIRCHTDSSAVAYPDELSSAQGRALLDDLAEFGVPMVAFSGGEPLVRRDTLDLAQYACSLGLSVTLCTNGTLLDLDTARRIRDIGVASVEISIAGIGAANDVYRGKRRAFERALQGIHHCKAAGQCVGLRLTLTPQTLCELDAIFDFVDDLQIERVTFAHVVAASRGHAQADTSRHAIRQALRTIARRARQFDDRGDRRRIFTADNDADGPFYYLMLRAQGRLDAADRAYTALACAGGGRSSSGVGIADIDSQGNVHPDRHWQSATLGNVKDRKFSEIWTDPSSELLADLRDRLPRLKGRCAACRYLDLCGGNCRSRALAESGDMWAPDPACHLSDAQIARDAEIVLV